MIFFIQYEKEITMIIVGQFEKVSKEQYTKDTSTPELYNDIKLPARGTQGSAGYDFHAPHDITLKPGETINIATGVRVRIDAPGWFLGILPRSGHGFKYRLQLDNTMGVIDADYYNADNEGHMFIKITNDGKQGKELHIEKGQGLAQGIFLPFGITMDDTADTKRTGGFGSTDK